MLQMSRRNLVEEQILQPVRSETTDRHAPKSRDNGQGSVYQLANKNGRLFARRAMMLEKTAGFASSSGPPKSQVANFEVLIARNVSALVYRTVEYGR